MENDSSTERKKGMSTVHRLRGEEIYISMDDAFGARRHLPCCRLASPAVNSENIPRIHSRAPCHYQLMKQ